MSLLPAALLRRVPGGGQLARRQGTSEPTGCNLVLQLVPWLDELQGARLPRAQLGELCQVQAALFVHLQLRDDALDGQLQAGGGDARPALDDAQARLRRLLAPRDRFWPAFRRLQREQEASDRWELAGRGRRLPRFDAALLRALGRKAALLRWPAWALPSLSQDARPAAAAARLDRIARRLIGALILLDDLVDFEEDAGRGQVNAVLSAGRASARAPAGFYPRAAAGAVRVCAHLRSELRRLRGQARGSGLGAACGRLLGAVDELEASALRRCSARGSGATLAAGSTARVGGW